VEELKGQQQKVGRATVMRLDYTVNAALDWFTDAGGSAKRIK